MRTGCPVRRRCSATRTTEWLTPFTFGRNDSATIAMRTFVSVRGPGDDAGRTG